MSRIPLFSAYPLLANGIHRLPFAILPTPIIPLKSLGETIGLKQLFLKQDGESGDPYGGNKIRKLEFIFADALAKKAKTVLTFGCAGSNHSLACGIYAKKLGLNRVSILMPQANAYYVRRNLLMSAVAGIDMHYYSSYNQAMQGAEEQKQYYFERDGDWPYVIPFGGSSVLGVIGFVNAAFELAGQVSEGLIPEPDVIYVALGSMGTAVGLCLGLKALGFKTTVKVVSVVGDAFANKDGFVKLFGDVNQLLCDKDRSFPKCHADNFEVVSDFFGEEYAVFTEQSIAAVSVLQKKENIKIEGTYTGKTLAALIDQAKMLNGKCVLFWNTANTKPYEKYIEKMDYHLLPPNLRTYFEKPVQQLDKEG